MADSKVKTLGCTGGIGSGKSYVAAIFQKMGYPVYYSDDRTKQLYDVDKELLNNMVKLLGSDILKDGRLDKRVVAAKIFTKPSLLKEVELIVHPAVLKDFNKWKMELDKPCSFVLFESAILLEKPAVKSCANKIMNVCAPYELRIERVIKRDNVTRNEVLARMARQWSDEQRNALADFTIFADSQQALLPQIVKVIEAMEKLN